MTRKEWLQKHWEDDRCYLCGRERSPDRSMIYMVPYGIRVCHNDACHDLVVGELRSFDKSKKGRWRSTSDVLNRLDAFRVIIQ